MNPGPTGKDRLIGSLIGLAAGGVLGVVSAATALQADIPTYVALSLATGMMVSLAGAIAGRRTMLYGFAGAGILAGVALVYSVAVFPKEQFSGSVGFGSGPGALAGSVIGLVVEKVSGWFR
jgi:hypothetical protein